jgi:ubiquinone/menaquinone biosynthesis C-methylase UbiE
MFPSFTRRSHKPERLDTGDYTDDEYNLWLQEARWINRYLGDARALRRALSSEPECSVYEGISILDVGAGSGELLKVASEAVTGKATLLVGAELNQRAVNAIRSRTPEFGVLGIQSDAMRLPFGDDSFDVVVCSLFLHHLTDEQGVRLLNEMARVARRNIIAIDLHRHPIAYFVYRTFGPLFLQRFTVEDGSLSILRSYRPDTLQALAESACLCDPNVRRSFPFRIVLTARPHSK